MKVTPFFLALGVAGSMYAQAVSTLSVDDLMNVEVTSVARRGQPLLETPAATYVITQEEIRRSGATTIPDLLRLAPGVDVAQINGNTAAVSARGFNGRYANKVIVLIDGRNVYSPISSGVRWDELDLLIEDIERIEVTRGPGGTLWGANAVNGIINIVTKRPIDAQGMLASVTAGGGDGTTGSFRYGGQFGSSGYYRAYAKAFSRPATGSPAQGGGDDWSARHAGFRSEWMTRFGSVNVQGDVADGRSDQMIDNPGAGYPFGGPRQAPASFEGHNLLFHWTAAQSKRSETSLLAYYDYRHRVQAMLNEDTRALDVDFQNRLKLGDRNDATWGAEWFSKKYATIASESIVNLDPPRDVQIGFTAFLQDEIRITPGLRLTAGSKMLHDEHGHTQWQPSLRGLWMVTPRQIVWAAVTRAVRSPSPFEIDGTIPIAAWRGPDGSPTTTEIVGNDGVGLEYSRTYEIGYRTRPLSALSLDVTAFRTSLRHIIGTETQAIRVAEDGRRILPIVFEGTFSGQSSGVEALVTLRPAERWDLTAGLSFFDIQLTSPSGVAGAFEEQLIDVPHHQAYVRSYLTLTPRLELDGTIWYVGGVPAQHVAGYIRTDLRLGWQVTPHLELSVAGRNLTDSRRLEFNTASEAASVTPTSRTISGSLTWRP